MKLLKSRLIERGDGGSGSDAESFSRTRSPDLFESGQVTPVPGAFNGTTFKGYGKSRAENEDENEVEAQRDQGVGDEDDAEAASQRSTSLVALDEETQIGNEQVLSPGESVTTPETPDDTPSRRVGCHRNMNLLGKG